MPRNQQVPEAAGQPPILSVQIHHHESDIDEISRHGTPAIHITRSFKLHNLRQSAWLRSGMAVDSSLPRVEYL